MCGTSQAPSPTNPIQPQRKTVGANCVRIVYNLVGGSPLWYPLSVVGLFVVYMAAFYAVARLLRIKKRVTVKT